MRYLFNSNKPVWLALLAILMCACEGLAWWWATLAPSNSLLQGAAWLGLAAALCALAISLKLLQQIDSANGLLRKSHDYKNHIVQMQHQLKCVKREAQKARLLLASSLDTLDVGLEIWDEQDRLLLYNKKNNQIRSNFHGPQDIGQTFEALARIKLEQHLIPAAIGREEKWLAQRMATRGQHKEPLLKELAGNQWVNTYENRTPEGYLVTAWVDVTELVRKSKLLEASNQQLAQQSSMDDLTGLANRRRFDEVLTNEWKLSARSVTPLSLLMVDIDHFKQYNDHYGHVAGDECLRRVAMVLDLCVRRAGELVARYGGEEFVMLLPGADMAHACETAEKCMLLMQKEAIPHMASSTCEHITVSIGVACLLPDVALEPTIMVNAADAAMYRAKTGGRARFEVADQADWEIDKDTPRTRPSPLT